MKIEYLNLKMRVGNQNGWRKVNELQMIQDLKKMLEKYSSLVKTKFLILKLDLYLGHNPFQYIVRKNNKCDHLSAYRPWRRVPCPWPQAGGRLLLLLAPLPSHPPSHPAGWSSAQSPSPCNTRQAGQSSQQSRANRHAGELLIRIRSLVCTENISSQSGRKKYFEPLF